MTDIEAQGVANIVNGLNKEISDLQSQLEERDERINQLKIGNTIRFFFTKVKDGNILFSIIDSLDGELIAMNIKPAKEVLKIIEYYLTQPKEDDTRAS